MMIIVGCHNHQAIRKSRRRRYQIVRKRSDNALLRCNLWLGKSYAKNVENCRRRKTAPTCAQRAQRLFAAAAQLIGK